jgi:hypothetical protein
MSLDTLVQQRFWNGDVPKASISASCSHDMGVSPKM